MVKETQIKSDEFIWPEVQEKVAAIKFGRKLRAVRKAKKMTQAQLGIKAGLEPAAISHFEVGARSPSLKNVIRLCKGLRCRPNDLIELD